MLTETAADPGLSQTYPTRLLGSNSDKTTNQWGPQNTNTQKKEGISGL